MSHYVNQPTGSRLYALTGVLMHVGAEANHGHYLAHIQEASKGRWFKFSDAHVEPLDGGSSSLGSEKDPLKDGDSWANSASSRKGFKLSKKCLRSNSAYMLVYSLKGVQSPDAKPSKLGEIVQRLAEKKSVQTERKPNRAKRASDTTSAKEEALFPVSFPLRLQAFVERDRLLFQEQISENRLEKRENLSKKETLHAKMRHFATHLVVDRQDASSSTTTTGEILSDEDELDDDFEFVSKALLQKYLENPASTESPTAAERIGFLCAHGKLNLDLLSDLKVITSRAADELHAALKIPSRDKWDKSALCGICVRNRCRQMILFSQLTADAKSIAELTKAGVVDGKEDSYLVGKSSLKRWRSIAKDNFTKTIEAETRRYLHAFAETQSPDRSPPLSPFLPTLNGNAENHQDDPAANHAFNEDIACVHANLCPKSEKKRTPVSADVWKKLRVHFPTCPEFPIDSKCCAKCMVRQFLEFPVKTFFVHLWSRFPVKECFLLKCDHSSLRTTWFSVVGHCEISSDGTRREERVGSRAKISAQ